MAVSYLATVEVRTTGDDLNGGGFIPGASGVDYSQQDDAEWEGTEATGSNANNNLVSVGMGFDSTVVGNLIQIETGTGAVVGFFQVTAFVNEGTITLDRPCGSVPSATDIRFKLGGALASLEKCKDTTLGIPNGVLIWITGTYGRTTSLAIALSQASGSGTNGRPAQIIGYGSTRGDNGRAVFRADANSIDVITLNQCTGFNMMNIEINGDSRTGARGMNTTHLNSVGYLWNWYVHDCPSHAMHCSNSTQMRIFYSRITACGGAGSEGAINSASGRPWHTIAFCEIHNNTRMGIGGASHNSVSFLIGNLIYANGAGGHYGATPQLVINNVFDGNTGAGFYHSSDGGALSAVFANNIYSNNTTYGRQQGGTNSHNLHVYNEAYYNNTSGQTHASFTQTHEAGRITLTGDPYTNRAAADFSLNNTAGGGAALRQAGWPQAWPRGLTTSSPDVGPAQAAAGGASPSPRAGFGGGFG